MLCSTLEQNINLIDSELASRFFGSNRIFRFFSSFQ